MNLIGNNISTSFEHSIFSAGELIKTANQNFWSAIEKISELNPNLFFHIEGDANTKSEGTYPLLSGINLSIIIENNDHEQSIQVKDIPFIEFDILAIPTTYTEKEMAQFIERVIVEHFPKPEQSQ